MRQVAHDMAATVPVKVHDPAPSRWSYRLHRLWLTPVYRRALRIGVPLAITAASVFWYISDADRMAQITDTFAEAQRAIEERPEFMVRMMSIEGASEELSEAVRDELSVRFPISSFDMDLDAMRLKVEAFNAVADARLRVRPGGVLAVEIEERVPAVIWRHGQGLGLLDATGHMVAGTTERGDWPDLPLVAGEDAEEAIPEALALLEAAGPIEERVRGLVRMGGRRWDVVLDRNQRLLLPEENSVAALERLIALDKARKMLERDITIVDFRNPRRLTVRLNTNAVRELRRIRDIESGGSP
ncbi:cell division protein FtsQ [Aliiruegeria haliotis]|uniref:Cell division protein FtsQ n=1 Tax=Aliiruegeria haliotis TaxID=1280846 RepID=A0A2T0RXW6_9RHOB|nr:cell division protein FtsQ/DivIB [Aliiruegeria haliotis]PRY26008.1 cell division protein FtsQ [Aliiruegeria haliotis]